MCFIWCNLSLDRPRLIFLVLILNEDIIGNAVG